MAFPLAPILSSGVVTSAEPVTPPSTVASNPTRSAGAVGMTKTTYSPAQLSALSQTYVFHWSPAAYFVVIFACLVVALITAFVIRHLIQSLGLRWNRRSSHSVQDGESWITNLQRTPRRRDTKLMEALRRGKISAPIASEDGHSARPSSTETKGSYEMDNNNHW